MCLLSEEVQAGGLGVSVPLTPKAWEVTVLFQGLSSSLLCLLGPWSLPQSWVLPWATAHPAHRVQPDLCRALLLGHR